MLVAKNSGRTARLEITITPENKRWIQKYGGVQKTGDGRYNVSEILDAALTQLRLDHGEESMLLEMLSRRQELEESLEELEHKARKLSGRELDVWASEYHERMAEIRQQARDEVTNKEETLIAFFAEVRDSIKKFKYFGVEDWLTIRGHWEDALSIGWTGSKNEFIQRWLLWDRATPMVTVEDKGGHGHA